MRVAISAGYDTTAHSVSWLVAHLAQSPELSEPQRHAGVVDEVLRLYPAGWLGSRRASADTEFEGLHIRRGTLILYSPYLTHRDPTLWREPLRFDPSRFAEPIPAWGFLPFAAGERSCLGRAFARVVLEETLTAMSRDRVSFLRG